MLKRLRWQLTLLYLLAALGLVVLVGGGSYTLLRNSFADTTDLAIQYRMATLFEDYHLPLPPELASARQAWLDRNVFPSPQLASDSLASPAEADTPGEQEKDDDEEHEEDEEDRRDEGDEQGEDEERHEKELYDARLAAIFILPLSADGDLLFNPNPGAPPITQDWAALSAALEEGSDLRTIRLPSGERARLLTYRTGSPQGDAGQAPAVLQIGRVLSDQDRALSQFRQGLFLIGGVSTVLLGLGSWWLSGRTLGPAQQAWDQQQAFVSNASHELRTPLTLIQASAEYALRSRPPTEHVPLLKDILAECEYMNRLVDDLLLLSRLDTHRLHLERERIPLENLLSEIMRQGEKLAQERGVTLSANGGPGVVWGDPTRLRQVLLILLDNALRFTPNGGKIRLEAAAQGNTARIVVQDSGSGIAPEHLPHVFERFYQAPGARDGGARNNGLGLSIAKSLLEAQGGKIKIESRLGQGTRVTVTLPFDQPWKRKV